MISLVTWLWNLRHRELIEETRALLRLHFFLKEVGIEKDLSVKELKTLLSALKQPKKV